MFKPIHFKNIKINIKRVKFCLVCLFSPALLNMILKRKKDGSFEDVSSSDDNKVLYRNSSRIVPRSYNKNYKICFNYRFIIKLELLEHVKKFYYNRGTFALS